MTTTPEQQPPPPGEELGAHRLAYLIAAVVIGCMLVLGYILYDQQHQNAEAEQKAEQLIDKLESRGLRAPVDIDIVTAALGTTGGAICETADDDLTQDFLRGVMANGAAGPGLRPITVDRVVIEGERAVLEVYCPAKLPRFEELVGDLDFDDVVRDD